MRLRDCLGNAHLMCFDKRKSLWEGVEADLACLGIYPRRFVMGSGEDASLAYHHVDRHTDKPLPDRQRLDYAEGLQKLLRRELEAGCQHCLVIEDDNKLHDLSLKTWAAVLEQSDGLDWDVFYLHGVRALSLTRPFSENILQLDSGLGFRAVVLKRPVMEAICRLTPSIHKGIDGLTKDLVHTALRLKVFSAYPCVLRGDRDQWSFQHERRVEPCWLDDCVWNRGAGELK